MDGLYGALLEALLQVGVVLLEMLGTGVVLLVLLLLILLQLGLLASVLVLLPLMTLLGAEFNVGVDVKGSLMMLLVDKGTLVHPHPPKSYITALPT